MRMRVLMVEGMPRPMVVIDWIPADAQDEGREVRERLTNLLPEYDVVVMSEVDLPQVK